MTAGGPAPRATWEAVVVGAGQAGLAIGYHLKKAGVRFTIVDAGTQIGQVWRSRWDSMRLLTPARYDAFPVPPDAYPHKDDVADYLQLYAKHFELPIELNTRVSRLDHDPDRFVLHTKNDALRAARVVVATGPFTCSYVPAFAAELDPSVVQLHSGAYRSPGQIPPGLAAAVSHKFLVSERPR